MSDYIDNVLVSLKRKYSKNELVAALSKKLEETQIQNGKLNAEILHLEHELKKHLQEKEINKYALKEINKYALKEVRKEKLYNKILEENKKLRKDCSNGILNRNNLICDILALKRKLQGLTEI